jgi:hypothetical protein
VFARCTTRRQTPSAGSQRVFGLEIRRPDFQMRRIPGVRGFGCHLALMIGLVVLSEHLPGKTSANVSIDFNRGILTVGDSHQIASLHRMHCSYTPSQLVISERGCVPTYHHGLQESLTAYPQCRDLLTAQGRSYWKSSAMADWLHVESHWLPYSASILLPGSQLR